MSKPRGTHVTDRILDELSRAYTKHGDEPWGRHEFYGILLEEVDELWDTIKGDQPLVRVHAEALQVAAVVVRYLDTGDRYGWGTKNIVRPPDSEHGLHP